jgi:hypothetical protein
MDRIRRSLSLLKPQDAELVRAGRVLTPASGFLHAFTHTLNPYMGCAFGDGGCGVYCYVAESPIGLYAGKPWRTWLRAKANAAVALRRDLGAFRDPTSVRVFMSSATDPYQPAEAKLRITRSILEVFREHPIGLLVVQTRSPSVEKDFDLLADMPFAWLSMTVETDDGQVRRGAHAHLSEHRPPAGVDATRARTRHQRAGSREPNASALARRMPPNSCGRLRTSGYISCYSHLADPGAGGPPGRLQVILYESTVRIRVVDDEDVRHGFNERVRDARTTRSHAR